MRSELPVEQSRGALLYALMDYDFVLIYPINPKFESYGPFPTLKALLPTRYRSAITPLG